MHLENDPFLEIDIDDLWEYLSVNNGKEVDYPPLPEGGIIITKSLNRYTHSVHYLDSGAYIDVFIRKDVKELSFWKDDKRHRFTGPCYYEYDINPVKTNWFFHGEIVDIEKLQNWLEERNEDLNCLSNDALLALELEYVNLLEDDL